MGKALAELGWPRHSFVISTKLFWGIFDDINMRNTTNRKYLLQAIDGSLERLGLDFVDILYCHRSDPGTPIEETVWAMSDIIAGGRRFIGAHRNGRLTISGPPGKLQNGTTCASR